MLFFSYYESIISFKKKYILRRKMSWILSLGWYVSIHRGGTCFKQSVRYVRRRWGTTRTSSANAGSTSPARRRRRCHSVFDYYLTMEWIVPNLLSGPLRVSEVHWYRQDPSLVEVMTCRSGDKEQRGPYCTLPPEKQVKSLPSVTPFSAKVVHGDVQSGSEAGLHCANFKHALIAGSWLWSDMLR